MPSRQTQLLTFTAVLLVFCPRCAASHITAPSSPRCIMATPLKTFRVDTDPAELKRVHASCAEVGSHSWPTPTAHKLYFMTYFSRPSFTTVYNRPQTQCSQAWRDPSINNNNYRRTTIIALLQTVWRAAETRSWNKRSIWVWYWKLLLKWNSVFNKDTDIEAQRSLRSSSRWLIDWLKRYD